MKKLLIFDIDGVLQKEEPLVKARFNALLEALIKKYGYTREQALKHYNGAKERLPENKKHTLIYKFMEAGLTKKEFFKILESIEPAGLVELTSNCEKTLKLLKLKNIIITYSNSARNGAQKFLRYLKINHYIDKLYSSEDFEESKPSPNNLKKILADMKFLSENTYFIGNSYEKDILPARDVGMKTILYDPEGKYKLAKNADYVIKDLLEIVDIV